MFNIQLVSHKISHWTCNAQRGFRIVNDTSLYHIAAFSFTIRYLLTDPAICQMKTQSSNLKTMRYQGNMQESLCGNRRHAADEITLCRDGTAWAKDQIYPAPA